MKKSYGILMLLPLLIGSCVKERAFEEKTIKARYVDSKYNTTCTLRYYSGSVIPYISLKEYHSLLYRGRTFKEGRDYLDIKTEKSSDGQIEYVVTVYGGHEARFIVESNTMVSDDLWSFKNTNLNNPDCPKKPNEPQSISRIMAFVSMASRMTSIFLWVFAMTSSPMRTSFRARITPKTSTSSITRRMSPLIILVKIITKGCIQAFLTRKNACNTRTIISKSFALITIISLEDQEEALWKSIMIFLRASMRLWMDVH